jgi:wobble nucleotide-excising tRNase
MDAIVKIITKENTITVTTTINFDPVELPYGCIGYNFNGTSQSNIENLNQFWGFVNETLKQSNMTVDDYVTLKSIEYDSKFYGISS